ncbi:pyridoxal 5'-phosphate synthase glutaminase subunit PdxT [Candidatus Woesearchaeota archaeon]|nr:pyridoxal 5'-phosphate synthase glutaminase subunit PdxT [Candidatus Woesearchaeota archaeon]
MMTTIGVLALQGDFREHIEMLKKCKVNTAEIRLPEDLKDIDGLIIPGGESTVMGNLMQRHNLGREIIKKHKSGMAVYGTCAGAILLAKDILGSRQPRLNLLDISIKRNDYGRQIDSFESELKIEGIGNFSGIFIRAPVIEKVNKGVKVLSRLNSKPVLVQKENVLASTFHPELTRDKRVHEYFVRLVRKKFMIGV